jgi:hypothetical protein
MRKGRAGERLLVDQQDALDEWRSVGERLSRIDPGRFGRLLYIAQLTELAHSDPEAVLLEHAPGASELRDPDASGDDFA